MKIRITHMYVVQYESGGGRETPYRQGWYWWEDTVPHETHGPFSTHSDAVADIWTRLINTETLPIG